MNFYFIFTFLSWFHDIYIYIYIYILIFSSFNFLKIMKNAYLSKPFNFISVYDALFSNFNCYKYLCSNASKHLEMMHKHFFKYALKHK